MSAHTGRSNAVNCEERERKPTLFANYASVAVDYIGERELRGGAQKCLHTFSAHAATRLQQLEHVHRHTHTHTPALVQTHTHTGTCTDTHTPAHAYTE